MQIWLITASDVTGREYHLGDGVPLVYTTSWEDDALSVREKFLASCSPSTRPELSKTLHVRKCDVKVLS